MQATTFKRTLLAASLIIALGAGYAKFGGLAISPAEALAAPLSGHAKAP